MMPRDLLHVIEIVSGLQMVGFATNEIPYFFPPGHRDPSLARLKRTFYRPFSVSLSPGGVNEAETCLFVVVLFSFSRDGKSLSGISTQL